MHRFRTWRMDVGGLGRYNQNEASQSSVFHNSKQLNSNRNICSVFISLKSVSSMPSHCCVPECTQRGYQSNDGEKVSFFNFTKALIKRKQWIHAIRRDEGKEFQINEKTKVCSLHFKSTDLKKSLNGRIHPLPDAVPHDCPRNSRGTEIQMNELKTTTERSCLTLQRNESLQRNEYLCPNQRRHQQHVSSLTVQRCVVKCLVVCSLILSYSALTRTM